MTVQPLEGHGLSRGSHLLRSEQFRALARFRSSIEHELRSPLSSISLNLELLSNEVADLGAGAAGALAETLASLRQAMGRMTGNVESLLRTVLPSGHRRTEAVDLDRALAELVALCRLEARLARVSTTVELPGRPWAMEIESEALRQALMMMAAEALEHAVAGGAIAISLAGEAGAPVIRFEVRPWRQAADGDGSPALGLAAEALGATLERQAGEGSLVIEMRLEVASEGGEPC